MQTMGCDATQEINTFFKSIIHFSSYFSFLLSAKYHKSPLSPAHDSAGLRRLLCTQDPGVLLYCPGLFLSCKIADIGPCFVTSAIGYSSAICPPRPLSMIATHRCSLNRNVHLNYVWCTRLTVQILIAWQQQVDNSH